MSYIKVQECLRKGCNNELGKNVMMSKVRVFDRSVRILYKTV